LEHVRLEVSDAQMHRITCWADQLGRTRAPRPQGSAVECGADSAKPEEAYAALLAPLRGKIRNPRLMIIPHGALHYVPFAALYDAKSRKYLVEDYTITYVPSASTLQFLRSKESPVVAGHALVLGAPLAPGQSQLRGAKKEAEYVANRLHTKAKLGEYATEDLLYHLGGKVNLEGVNLVVLAACRSGVGKRSGGDEVVGLTRSILYAGSPGVISTLWNISDEATTPLIEKFYDHLLTGPRVETSVADALRGAQIDLLRDPQYSNPRYWAAFVLTGDPKGRWNQ
jgi:CHAT domain-containing protein